MPTNRKKAQDDEPMRDDVDRDLEDIDEQDQPRRTQQTSGSNPNPADQSTTRQGGKQGRGSSNTKKRK